MGGMGVTEGPGAHPRRRAWSRDRGEVASLLGGLAVGKSLAGKLEEGEQVRTTDPSTSRARAGGRRNQLWPRREAHHPSGPSVLQEGAGTSGLPPAPGASG